MTLPSNRSHRWKVLGIGVAANASFSAAFLGIPTTAVLMRTAYGLDNAHLGLVLGLLGLGIAVSELPWGLLTDSWGDRRVLLTGLGTTAAALAMMSAWASPHGAYVPAFYYLALSMLVVGVLGGSVNGSSGRAVMSWFDEGERGLAMSIRQIAVPLGGGLGAAVLPYVAGRWGFVAVFATLAAVCAVTTSFVWLWVYEPPKEDAPHSIGSGAASVAAPRSPLKDPVIWGLVVGMGVLCIPQFAVLTFATVFLHDYGRASIPFISATMSAIQMLAIVLRVLGGRWTDKRRNRREYLRLCCVTSLLSFGLLGAVAGWHALVASGYGATALSIIIAIAGLLVMAWQGVAYAELATLAGTSRAGTALGMANTFMYTAFFLVPAVIPWMIAVWSWPVVWFAAAVCGAVTYFLFPRPLKTAVVRVEKGAAWQASGHE
ncbi:MFS transporter [Trinickia fusca]|uniref:MFS transporter n=2 Tax=Trinickia fusca TaxID=2419777 RepID=A0A494XLN9_9BURK|nr:MFS transporter [Trinickia fusca]